MIFNADLRGGRKLDTVHWINCARSYDGHRTATRRAFNDFQIILYNNNMHKFPADWAF